MKPDSTDPRLIEAQLENLETLRSVLGDEAYLKARQNLERQRAALVDTGGGNAVLGNATAHNGDVVLGDQIFNLNGQADDFEALLRGYYKHLAEECRRLPLGTVDPNHVTPDGSDEVTLTSVYTALDLVSVPRRDDENSRAFGLRLARGDEGERTPVLDLVAGDDGKRLVLVGDAGSGKSTFVDYLTQALAAAPAGEPADDVPETLAGLLPVRLVLRRLAPLLDEAPKSAAALLWHALEADIAGHLGEPAAARLCPELQRRVLADGGRLPAVAGRPG